MRNMGGQVHSFILMAVPHVVLILQHCLIAPRRIMITACNDVWWDASTICWLAAPGHTRERQPQKRVDLGPVTCLNPGQLVMAVA